MATSSRSAVGGFTLIEVLIAMLVFVAAAIGVAQLFASASASGIAARHQTSATILATAKIEQLRSLTWTWEVGHDGSPPAMRSDLSTDLSVDPPDDGGRGLRESPPGTLDANVPPYVDYLDAEGEWAGNGASPPAAAVFVRRWSIRALPADPSRTLVLQVLVTPVSQGGGRPRSPSAPRSGSEALLTSVRTRTGL
jgi:prepilin-type N-terminal cleavage/methylation domain-containing protein